VPALRSRPADVRALSEHFLRQIAGEVGSHDLSDGAMAVLMAYDWPGNVRELRNVLCAAAAQAGARIEAEDVARELERISGRHPSSYLDAQTLRHALERFGGNQAATARALGMARSTLRDKLRLMKPSAA
jgi:DNA-binding NtrC family response regulator